MGGAPDGTGAQTGLLSDDPISHYLAGCSRKFSLRHLIQTFKAPLGGLKVLLLLLLSAGGYKSFIWGT